jgi:acyl-CoA thioester hydrolase
MTIPKAPHWTATAFRVRYAETDQMGVVYHANYFVWFEIGRAEICRAYGFAYRDMERHDGLYIIVAEARCRFKAPAKYDDEIEVRTCLRDVKKRVLVFGYEIYRMRDQQLLAEGETTHVVTDRDGRPSALPEKYAALFRRGLAAGAPGASMDS